MRKYYSGITLFKLIGSLLVLFGHVRLPLTYLHLTQQLPGLSGAMACVVPCFYTISGFLAYKGWTGAADPLGYVRRYLLWLGGIYLGFCGLAIANGAARPWHLPVRTMVLPVLKFFFIAGPYGPLWFVPPLLVSVAVVYGCYHTGRLRSACYLAAGGFVLAQLGSGTSRTVLEYLLGPLPLYYLRYTDLFVDALGGYLGIGFPFVLAGVLVARHEAQFRALPGRVLAAVALGSVGAELLLLHYVATPAYGGPRLVWSMVPVGACLFYGVLRIRLEGIRRHHAFISRFSLVLYLVHWPLITLNLALFNWPSSAKLTVSQSVGCVLLTALQCWLLALALHAYLRRPRSVPQLAAGSFAALPEEVPGSVAPQLAESVLG